MGLATAAVILFLATIAVGGALQARLAPWPGIGLIMLAMAAFAVSWKQKSFAMAGLLAASGVIGLTYGLIVTQFLAVVEFPGPVFGIIIGLPILGLGVVKGIEAARPGSKTTITNG